jgi:hypothetical protein
MATLALGALGAAAGSALLPGGLSLLGTTLTGAALGGQLGALGGSLIDQALFGGSSRRRTVDGPRLADLHVTASTEGAAIPRLYGRARLGGQVIWATALEEEAVARQASGGGKGGAAGRSAAGVDYIYYANVAIGLCEGVITALTRVWADGREIDLSRYTARLYTGTETQNPDPLIAGKQGGEAPAYRGLAYLVFERLPLTEFGNRLPQFSFEVARAVDTLEQDIRGVVLIPGAGEFAYAPTPVTRSVGRLTQVAENVATRQGGTDWQVSLGQLQSTLPNAKSVSLVVAWFGDDLRAGTCTLRPRVDRTDKITSEPWSVAGLTRATALTVSQHDGRAAYGGTPSDATVVAALKDLRARGLSPVFSPFLLMDVPVGNGLPDPYTSAPSQPAYPWRGRVTVSPAAGLPGSPDRTAAAATQIAAFVGTAQPADFAIVGETVIYSGPPEWSFRRFILHYAHLCVAAGGVDAFVLCSELRGLTTARSATSSYPFVTALAQLAAEVRGILGPATKLTYAADWSEYFGHQPADGSGDVHFHLDPLWASPAIDALGVDVYWPLADWRDGDAHLDALAGAPGSTDLSYLKSNLVAGEGYDWYYADAAARRAQVRTPITDGLGKPWLFRFKDLRSWWREPHYDRIAGAEQSAPTAWMPQSKPFWFLEIGAPAVDKAANQPNVFVDAKSAETALPHFSSGARDDLAQRRIIQAFVESFNPDHPDFVAALNPVSVLDGRRMVDAARIHVYCWDARPYPAFPERTELWSDGANWRLGHWLVGRVAAAPVPALVARVLADHGVADVDASRLDGTVAGLVVDRTLSAREALSGLELAAFVDLRESDGRLVFSRRATDPSRGAWSPEQFVDTTAQPGPLAFVRTEEVDLPRAAKLSFISATGDYAAAVAEARRAVGATGRIAAATLGLVLDPSEAQAIAETWLHETWLARDRATFSVPPSALALEPGDLISLDVAGQSRRFRITQISDHGARAVEAVAVDPAIYRRSAAPARLDRRPRDTVLGPPLALLLDIPPGQDEPAHTGLVAAAQVPWPGSVAVFRAPETTGYTLSVLLAQAAITGLTASPFPAGPVGRLDRGAGVDVVVDRGELSSVSDLALLAGANMAAVEVAPDTWEILQFRTATLLAPNTYALRNLLRGLRGTESLMASVVPTGARFVLLDAAVRPVELPVDQVGLPLNWRIGPASRDIGDPSYTTHPQTFTGRGLVPFAPVHVRAARALNGDLTLTWVRRTRIAGDSWETIDVPLGETAERYAVEILDGPVIKRSFELSAPSLVYTAAEQSLDFGSPQSAVTFRLTQLDPGIRRGHTRTLVR